MYIQATRIHASIALQSIGDECPDTLPQQFGVGELVTLGAQVGEIYRSAIGITDYCETTWNADPNYPTRWERMYWVKLPNDTLFVTEAQLLESNPRPPSVAVLAHLGVINPEQQAIQTHLEMTNALWAIQRLARDVTPVWMYEPDVASDVLREIAERALQALGKTEAPAVIQAGYSVTGL